MSSFFRLRRPHTIQSFNSSDRLRSPVPTVKLWSYTMLIHSIFWFNWTADIERYPSGSVTSQVVPGSPRLQVSSTCQDTRLGIRKKSYSYSVLILLSQWLRVDEARLCEAKLASTQSDRVEHTDGCTSAKVVVMYNILCKICGIIT